MDTFIKNFRLLEFGQIAEIRKEKVNPFNSNNDYRCIELEHLEQNTGKINGWVSSLNQKSIKNVFRTDDVLFGKLRPYLKKYWLADFEGVCSSEIWVLKPKDDKIIPQFLFYFIQMNNFIQVANVSSGSKMPRADWGYVEAHPFLIPVFLKEQKAIADCLSSWDKAIELQRELILSKEVRKKSLAQQLLTGKRRLPGFTDEWKEEPYGKLLSQVKRKENWEDNHLYHLISVRRRSGGIFHRESLYGHQIAVKELMKVKKDDFLISKMQILHGASSIVNQEFENFYVSGSYIILNVTNPKKLSPDYLDFYSKQKIFYHQTYISSYGVHIEKMTFDFKTFLKMNMILPSIEEQNAIVKVLETADKELQLEKQKLADLQQQKRALMQQLLTGKVRLV